MIKRLLFILLALLLCTEALAQEGGVGSLISPGELTSPHAKYEGISNCTQCHSLGGGIPDSKCLDCHDKLAERIKAKKGVHANYIDACIKCHTDHKGKGFRIISLEKEKFDHGKTDYPLADKHAKVDCNKCHKKGDPYAGISQECGSCHKDPHKDAPKCKECHTTEGWNKVGIDHSKTKYPLVDKHIDVKCGKCHKKSQLTGIPFKSCESSACHNDPHNNQFENRKCEECHNIKGWKPSLFDHSAPKYTGYKLEGKHTETRCEKCHVKGKYRPLNTKSCNTSDCHNDVHKGQFKNQKCEACHTVKGWGPSLFEHNAAVYKGYKLEGKHVDVECKKCHVQGKYRPLSYKSCDTSDCHKDTHKGQFKSQKCEACHILKGWKPSLFEHNAPPYSGYRLDGKHVKTPCEKCHVDGKYKPLSDRCYDCHEKDDTHKKELGNNCEKCHNTTDWKKHVLDHNKQTKFPLIGKHKSTECEKCHKDKKYKTRAEKCVDCHKDVHKGKFKEECSSCHTQNDWFPRKFDHKKESGIELKGVHNDITCNNCHKTKDVYKGANRYCVQCHQDPHLNQFGRVNCTKCHSEDTWNPVQFNHSNTGYALTGKHRTAECQDCHRNRIYRNTTSACIGCHQGQYDSAASHVSKGYSRKCTDCHTDNFSSWVFKHTTAAKNCAGCHMSSRPLSHTTSIAKNAATCETCHNSTTTWTSHIHPVMSNGCNSCHMNDKPQSHANNPAAYPATCEICHTSSNNWSSYKHTTATTGCSTCHLSYSVPAKPANHGTNNWVACENCHAFPDWSFVHTTAATGCSTCHATYSAPAKPASHATNNWTTCEVCHKSTVSWAFTHTTATTGCASCHSAYSTPAKPADHTTSNWTTCESCHRSTTTWAFSHGTTTTGCSSCHATYSTPVKPQDHTANNWATCENCHKSTTSWVSSYTHGTATTGCASCHLAYSTPAKPQNHSTNNWTVCETCHKSTVSWAFTHTAATTGCASCHSAYSTPAKPASHTTNNWTTCETCHKSTTAWTFSHGTTTTNCTLCHASYSTPARPASHTTNNWTTCQNCHKSTATWAYTHSTTTFPLNHEGTNPANCVACHPGGNYYNSGGCIECHTIRGEKVHQTNLNSGCLRCHPDGNK